MKTFKVYVTDANGNYSASNPALITQAKSFLDAAHNRVGVGTIMLSSKPIGGGCLFKGQRVYRLTQNRRLIVRAE
jgi:hypothetical protein